MALVINPVAFDLGPLSVHWYGIILGTAALVGLFLAVQEGKRFGIIPDFFMDLLLIGVPSAIVGARLYYVAFKWSDYKDHPLEIIKIWHGGIAIYGALIGAVIGAYFYTKRKGYGIWRIFDICAPSLIAGQMIGRWGNFMNQEAHGAPVDVSFLRNTLHLPSFIVDQMNIEGVYYHPTFLYESLWNLLVLLFLLWLRRRPGVRTGEMFMSYLIGYSIGRFWIEGLRTDSLAFDGPAWLQGFIRLLWSPMKLVFEEGSMDYGNIRVSQLLSLILIIGAVVFMVYRRKKGLAETRYADPIVAAGGTATVKVEAPNAPQANESAVVVEKTEETSVTKDEANQDAHKA